jgi:hypothetical protein
MSKGTTFPHHDSVLSLHTLPRESDNAEIRTNWSDRHRCCGAF